MPALTLVVTLLLLAAAGSAAPARAGAAPGPVEEVLAADDARFAAMVAADVKALGGLLADDLTYVHSTGRVETKEEFLKAVGSRTIRYLEVVPAERQVRLLDASAAVVMGRADARVVLADQERRLDLRYVAVYGRADGRWRLRAWQSTRIAPPES